MGTYAASRRAGSGKKSPELIPCYIKNYDLFTQKFQKKAKNTDFGIHLAK